MEDRLDIYRSSSNIPTNNTISRKGLRTFADPKNIELSPEQIAAGTKDYFKSKFKSWIRAVAFLVLFTFIPDQVSWAFNYNPAVIWGDKSNINFIFTKFNFYYWLC